MKLFFTLFAALSLFIGCKKVSNNSSPQSQLPDTTHVGANTFGCLIDGKVYKTSGRWDIHSLSPHGVGFNPPTIDGYMIIFANNVFDLSFQYSGSLGTFTMAGNYPYKGYYYFYSDSGGTTITGGNEFSTDATHTGAITITYYDSTILAGTFYFDCVNDSGRVVHITDGRFDISL